MTSKNQINKSDDGAGISRSPGKGSYVLSIIRSIRFNKEQKK